MTSLNGINHPSIQMLLRGENDSKQSDEIQAKPEFAFLNLVLKGHSQLWNRADLDTTFAGFEKRLPQPEIKSTCQINLEIHFNPS